MTRTTPHGRRALAAACGIALAFACAQAADARLGELDPSFDGDGIATPALGFASSLRAAAIQPDGAIVAGGSITDTQPAMLVTRVTPSGALDTSFGAGGVVIPAGSIEDGAIAALAIALNGDILAAGGGAAGNIETNPNSVLARITPAGAPTNVPLPVANVTSVTADFVSSIALMPSGHVVLGGWAINGGDDQFMAMRLLPTLAPDTSFSGDGVAFADLPVPARAAGVSVDGLGRVTLTGQAGSDAAAARLTSGGALDPAFNGTGTVQVSYPGPFAGDSRFFGAVQRGETVLAAGAITRGTQAVVQALANGAGDPSFGVAGIPGAAIWGTNPVNSGESVAATSTGGAVVAGRTGNVNAASLQMAWLTATGAPDPAGGGFAVQPVALTPVTPTVGLAVAPGDTAVVAGTTPANAPVVARFLGNAAPAAALAAADRATAGAPVTFDAGASSDPEGEALRFAFDLDGNGSYELDGGANPLALRSFAAPGSYTVGLRVTDPRGATASAARTVTVTAAAVAPPRPVLGKQGVAKPVRGIVRVRLPGTRRFVRLTDLTAIPNGTEIDARKGRVLITVLHDASGRLDGARFYAGRFFFNQGKGATPITTLKLSGGSFAACRAGRSRARGSVLAVAARATARRKKPVRKLWGDGRGRFRTRGKYGAATVRGTKWLTQDRCDGTRVQVERGKVDVTDVFRPKRKPKRLDAGDAVLIGKPR